MFNDEIELGRSDEVVEFGEILDKIDWSTVMANQLDGNRSEFYQGMAVGLRPEKTFEIHEFEYDNEKFFRYPTGDKGIVYTIIRSPKIGNMIELVGTTHTGVDPIG